jgi:divalent metal cation (Fe/Co/Zn/Cd) transporter
MQAATPSKESTPNKADASQYSADQLKKMHGHHSMCYYASLIFGFLFILAAVYIVWCAVEDEYMSTANVAAVMLLLGLALGTFFYAYGCHKKMCALKGQPTEFLM